jgi:hypothetical protein
MFIWAGAQRCERASFETSHTRGNRSRSGQSRRSWTNARRCDGAGETCKNPAGKYETPPTGYDTAADAKPRRNSYSAHAGNPDTGSDSEPNAESEPDTKRESHAQPQSDAERQPDSQPESHAEWQPDS